MPVSIASRALVAALVLCVALPAAGAVPAPPKARATPVVDTYYGTKVVDPYRWMEAGGQEFTAYLKAQNDRTRAVLDALPGRAALEKRIADLSAATAPASSVERLPNSYLYERQPPGSDAVKLYVRGESGGERLLLDPGTLPGPRQAISYATPSDDGRFVAVGLAAGGTENASVRVVDVATGKLLPDAVPGARFGVTGFSPNDKSFVYVRLTDPAPGDPPAAKYLNVKSYEHVIGDDPVKDRVLFGAGMNPAVTAKPTEFAYVSMLPDSPFAVGVLREGVARFSTVYVAPKASLANPATAPWRKVVDPSDRVLSFEVHGSTMYGITVAGAPRGKLLAYDLTQPAAPAVLVPASARVLDRVVTAKDGVYVAGRDDGLGRMSFVPYGSSTVRAVALPVNGTIGGIATRYDRPGYVASLEGWTTPAQWYAGSGTAAPRSVALNPPSAVDYTGIVSEEVTVPARDGTPIPLSLVHRADVKRDGSAPTLLYAYGSYGISSSPGFSATRLAWLERGAIFAVAHVRGGGEYGEEWHLAGKDANKVRTYTDFIDCARWLVANEYTSPGKLGARGGSAGGITMGMSIAEAPELFAGVLDEIPVSDQLRIELSANGPPNVPEFGTVKTPDGFANLYATSPVQHLKKGTPYPAVMLTTGANDPRVDPWQAAKMTATLQADTSSTNPVLLRVDYDGGHGLIGAGRAQAVALTTDEYAFLLAAMHEPGFELP